MPKPTVVPFGNSTGGFSKFFLAAVCLMLIQPAALAQQVIEEVIVTATKREESLQDIPIAVSAYDSGTLQQAGVRDIRQLQILSPSLVVSSSAAESAGTVARIRGVGTTGDNAGLESSVAIFIDGVYRNRNNIGLTDLGDVERIEVLRGPQGTLFGKNASAGLIHIITAGPDFEFGGYGEAEFGNEGYARVSGGITGPLIDNVLAGRLDATWTERDGFIDTSGYTWDDSNLSLLSALYGQTGAMVPGGEDYNDRDRYLIRGQLQWNPTDDLDIRIIGDYTDRDETCCNGTTYINGPSTPLINGIAALRQPIGEIPGPGVNDENQAFDRNNFVNQEVGYQQDVEDYGVSAEINWQVRGGTLTSITSYRDWDYDRSMDIDFTAVDILRRNPSGFQQEFETLTQELRFAHTVGRLDWLVGAYFVDEDLTLDDAVKSGRDYEAYVDGIATMDPTSGLLSLLTGIPQGQVFTEDNGVVRDLFEVETTSWALFTHNVFHLNDQWDFTLGLRYTDEEKDLDSSLLADNPACLSIIQNPAAPASIVGLTCLPFFSPLVDGTYSGSRSDEEWTGVLSVAYNFNDNWMAYGSVSRGYKAGGYNLDRAGLDNPLVGLVPDVTDLGV